MLNTRNEDTNTLFYPYVTCCEYMCLEYVRVHVVHRANQAEYGIHVLVVAPQEDANIRQ